MRVNKKLLLGFVMVFLVGVMFVGFVSAVDDEEANKKDAESPNGLIIDDDETKTIDGNSFSRNGEVDANVKMLGENSFKVTNAIIESSFSIIETDEKSRTISFSGDSGGTRSRRDFTIFKSDPNLATVITRNNLLKISANGEKPYFKLGENGELVAASFTMGETGKLKIGNLEFEVPEGGEVDFGNGVVEVKVPEDYAVKIAKRIDDSKEDGVELIYFKLDGSMKLVNSLGEEIEISNGKQVIEIGVRDGRFYSKDKDLRVKNSEGIEDIYIHNANEDGGDGEFDLVFDENNIDQNRKTVYLGKDRLEVISKDGRGPAVSLKEGNRYGVIVDDQHSAAVLANKGRAVIHKQKDDDVPLIEFSGWSRVSLDKKSFFGGSDGENFYFIPEEIIDGVDHKDLSTFARLRFIDDDGGAKKKYDVYANDRNQFASAREDQLESKSEFYGARGGFFVSNKVSFNQLTPEEQRLFSDLSESEQSSLISASNVPSEQGFTEKVVANMKRILGSIKRERITNPLKAVAKVVPGPRNLNTGGSGMVVGVDNSGHPIILTAGHVYPGRNRMWIQLADRGFWADRVDTKFTGKRDRFGNYIDLSTGNDVSIFRSVSPQKNTPYVPIAGTDHELLTSHNNAYRITYRGLGKLTRAPLQLTNVFDGRLAYFAKDTTPVGGPVKGDSGGPVVHEGKVVGVVSTSQFEHGTGGGYVSFRSAIDILNRNNLGYLIGNLFQVLLK